MTERNNADTEHWRRIREQIEHEKQIAWLEQKIENLEALLHETVCELNACRERERQREIVPDIR